MCRADACCDVVQFAGRAKCNVLRSRRGLTKPEVLAYQPTFSYLGARVEGFVVLLFCINLWFESYFYKKSELFALNSRNCLTWELFATTFVRQDSQATRFRSFLSPSAVRVGISLP